MRQGTREYNEMLIRSLKMILEATKRKLNA